VTLDSEDLNGTDIAILNALEEGRVTPPLAGERAEVSREYATERLVRLKEHGHVERVHRGLYELMDDPR